MGWSISRDSYLRHLYGALCSSLGLGLELFFGLGFNYFYFLFFYYNGWRRIVPEFYIIWEFRYLSWFSSSIFLHLTDS